MITYLCNCIDVSKSGYYNYFQNEEKRKMRDKKDKHDFELILKAYKFKNRKKGARQIRMVLENEFNIIFNLKKIRRLMKKFGLKCPIRQANPYRRMMKATKEHSTCENLVNRIFKTGIPYNVLLTDITYLAYGNNKRCYLSTIKDAETNEILAYYISESLELNISLETVKRLRKNKTVILNENVKLHSDQGSHYTSPKFHSLVKKYNIQQSMSRRGNCWDNAPQESYFGHMKDELNLDTCFSFRDVCNEIKDYIEYYNNYRYQWNLKKMTPVKYRNHLLASFA
jgi:transposase InsO family protein